MRTLVILVGLILLSGCDTVRTTPVSSSKSKQGTSADGVARHSFHRDVELSDVTKMLPKGSVDYVDLDMADNPNVLVVVTASAAPQDGLTFTSAFTNNGNRTIEKKWSPATSEGDDEHVGIFVLPRSFNNGRTFRSRNSERASIDDIIF